MSHLHFVQALDPLRGGGLGAASLDLHTSMRSLGVESSLLATRGQGERVRRDGVQTFVRRGPDKAFLGAGLASAARTCMDTATVVHGHGLYVHPNMVVPRMARKRGIPVVYHPHGMLEPWALSRSRMRKKVVGWLFENENMHSASLWRALTIREADQIRQRGVEAPIVVAPNGVELSDFPLRDPGETRANTPPTLLFLGRIHPKKGLPVLIDAWGNLVDSGTDWRLVIAGPDEAGHRAQIESAIQQRGVGNSVTFTGPVDRARRAELLRSADAFVLSSHSEGFPLALIEAMATGLPIVASHESNLVGLSERNAGIECDANPESVLSALDELMFMDDDARRQMGEAGRAWVEEEFTWPVITQQLLSACAEYLA